ncbi:esterase, partial [Streptomyces sp. NPDC055144]
AYAARPREAGVDVTAVRVLGMVHDFLMLDRMRDAYGARGTRHLAIDAPETVLDN